MLLIANRTLASSPRPHWNGLLQQRRLSISVLPWNSQFGHRRRGWPEIQLVGSVILLPSTATDNNSAADGIHGSIF